jgi:hypothetical protein
VILPDAQAYYPTVPFPIDHIIARQHGGRTTFGNLALSCLHDNSQGANIAGIDPLTRNSPRSSIRDGTSERHFRWNGPTRSAGLIGRTTIVVLAMNDLTSSGSVDRRSKKDSSAR